MLYLTEKERLEAIAACERIEQAGKRLQRIVKDAQESLEQMRRDFPFPLRATDAR